jgi:hypothetical protein
MTTLKDKLEPRQTWPGVGSTVLSAHQRQSIGATKKLAKYALPVPVGAAGPRDYVPEGTYDGAELRTVPARSGANDHKLIKNIGIEST